MIDLAAGRRIAQRAAERGLVLLKNEADTLPVAQGLDRILVIGRHADVGVLAGGGPPPSRRRGAWSSRPASTGSTNRPLPWTPSGPRRAQGAWTSLDGTDHDAAVIAVQNADLVVILAEEWRAEGHDMQGVGLPDGQEDLIGQVAAANPRTVVVIESGGGVSVPWASKVPAVIAAFYPGSGGAETIAGVLSGRVNSSGHLPVTFPAQVAQLPRPEQRDPATTTSNPNQERIGEIFEVPHTTLRAATSATDGSRAKHTPRTTRSAGGSRTRPSRSAGSPSPQMARACGCRESSRTPGRGPGRPCRRSTSAVLARTAQTSSRVSPRSTGCTSKPARAAWSNCA